MSVHVCVVRAFGRVKGQKLYENTYVNYKKVMITACLINMKREFKIYKKIIFEKALNIQSYMIALQSNEKNITKFSP